MKKNPYLNDLKGNDLVLELCKISNTETYISGTGCTDFIIPESFKKNKIEFKFQEFPGLFASKQGENLSILDNVLRLGSNKLLNHLNEDMNKEKNIKGMEYSLE